jgi:hypothetical protein
VWRWNGDALSLSGAQRATIEPGVRLRMKTRQEPDGRLIVTHDDTGWAKLLLAGAVLFLGLSLHSHFSAPRNTDRAIGALGGFATCLVASLVLFERSVFIVDPRIRLITWQRRRAWTRREGSVRFDEVKAVAVQTPIGDTGIPSRRIAFMTAGGELPISVSYSPDHDDECLRIAARVQTALGHAAGPSTSENVRALLASGRTMDAIRQLRQEDGLSLEEAKRRVDELRMPPPQP